MKIAKSKIENLKYILKMISFPFIKAYNIKE